MQEEYGAAENAARQALTHLPPPLRRTALLLRAAAGVNTLAAAAAAQPAPAAMANQPINPPADGGRAGAQVRREGWGGGSSRLQSEHAARPPLHMESVPGCMHARLPCFPAPMNNQVAVCMQMMLCEAVARDVIMLYALDPQVSLWSFSGQVAYLAPDQKLGMICCSDLSPPCLQTSS